MMFEPKTERVVDPSYVKQHNANEIEKTRLLKNKLKNEKRNAEKELRKDAEFINTAKVNKQFKLDEERKRKVNVLLGQLSNQEGDVRKIKKKKYNMFQ